MQALRTRAACAARRARPNPTITTPRISRSYASESHSHGHDHHHHHAPEAAEGLGTAFYVFAAAIPVSYVAYSISRPGANGEESSLTKWMRNFDYFNDWELRNALRSNMIDQAAHDKHLLLHARTSAHVELKMPELLYAGSPWNVPAGHYANIDHVTEHYRQQAAAEEERRAKLLAARAKAAQEQQEQQKL
ncbi:uncharacterized protein F4812DRAFT_458406 [Daldinia caldariorum]|uniref:uncharacterized protein n=1 Tax=Daldinia caldariorum TaxID=326644 RepID=UPI00200898D2|nr:uncharacterized protein F4812DRAFT_458406 [Daldinia caldariorum]KAI1468879.1 hypothetical protein F4812DRAFT_458406 [Daldinia caldariorum]